MSNVSRQKYEKAKSAATVWHDILEETKNRLDETLKELETSREEIKSVKNDNVALKEELKKWKRLSEDLPDPNEMEEVLLENKTLNKTIREMKKQEEKYKDKLSQLERDKLLSEGKIQQLEEARKDMYERYNELKQDYRWHMHGTQERK